jgi:hypothetical protein
MRAVQRTISFTRVEPGIATPPIDLGSETVLTCHSNSLRSSASKNYPGRSVGSASQHLVIPSERFWWRLLQNWLHHDQNQQNTQSTAHPLSQGRNGSTICFGDHRLVELCKSMNILQLPRDTRRVIVLPAHHSPHSSRRLRMAGQLVS